MRIGDHWCLGSRGCDGARAGEPRGVLSEYVGTLDRGFPKSSRSLDGSKSLSLSLSLSLVGQAEAEDWEEAAENWEDAGDEAPVLAPLLEAQLAMMTRSGDPATL